jgi:hypothetical protein
LVVDADAGLPGALAFQGFEPVARRGTQEVERLRSIELSQFALGHCSKAPEPPWIAACEKRLCVLVAKRLNHVPRSVLRLA